MIGLILGPGVERAYIACGGLTRIVFLVELGRYTGDGVVFGV